jgi:hypothetical protein
MADLLYPTFDFFSMKLSRMFTAVFHVPWDIVNPEKSSPFHPGPSFALSQDWERVRVRVGGRN